MIQTKTEINTLIADLSKCNTVAQLNTRLATEMGLCLVADDEVLAAERSEIMGAIVWGAENGEDADLKAVAFGMSGHSDNFAFEVVDG